MTFKNYYTILGVKSSANLEEIKTAFRQLAKKYHPDKNSENKSAEDFFKELQEAYETLSNVEKRGKYDLKFKYASNYKPSKQRASSQYTGNAYQYAQQQAQQNRQRQTADAENEFVKTERKDEKIGSDSYFFVISIIAAILLLIFIISYSNKGAVSP